MLGDNLRLFYQLYFQPRKALSGIVDEGSLLFGALAMMAVSVLIQASLANAFLSLYARAAPATAPATQATRAADEEDPVGGPGPALVTALPSLLSVSIFGVFSGLLSLAALYVPSTVLLVTLFERVGSFGVAMRRDYGPLLACTLMSFAAAFLPAGLVAAAWGAAQPGFVPALVSFGAALAWFAVLMVLAIRTVMGARTLTAVGAVAVSWVSFALQPFLAFLASPFLLYYGWLWLRGDLGDVLGSWGARQSFRRYLEAATVNPRDAEAHYQLGLIHQHRHQPAEAAERFKKAIEIDPGEVDAHFQLARMARAESRWEEAIAHLEQVLQRNPAHARHEAWREAGAVYVATEGWENARTVLDRFVQARSYDPEGLFQLGLACRKTGDETRAKEMFERCVEAARTAPDYRRSELREWRRRAEQALAGKE